MPLQPSNAVTSMSKTDSEILIRSVKAQFLKSLAPMPVIPFSITTDFIFVPINQTEN